jgi:hypothetical protein
VKAHQSKISKTAIVSENQSTYWGIRYHQFGAHSKLTQYLTSWNIVEPDTPLFLDAVWRYAPTDPWTGLPIPEFTTHRTIDIGRELSPERCLVHYLPPHTPYRATAVQENRPPSDLERNPWEYLSSGTSKDRIWNLYLDELRWALDNIQVLLKNYNAEKVVITADHGELFGEWGLSSHPSGIPHSALRKVPWVEISATDTKSREVKASKHNQDVKIDNDKKSQLKELGYIG